MKKTKLFFGNEEMKKEFLELPKEFQTDKFLRYIPFADHFSVVGNMEEADIVIDRVDDSPASIVELVIKYGIKPAKPHIIQIWSREFRCEKDRVVSNCRRWEHFDESVKALVLAGYLVCEGRWSNTFWRQITQRLIMYLKERNCIHFAYDAPSLRDTREIKQKYTIYFAPELKELQNAFLNMTEDQMINFHGRNSYFECTQFHKYLEVTSDPACSNIKVWYTKETNLKNIPPKREINANGSYKDTPINNFIVIKDFEGYKDPDSIYSEKLNVEGYHILHQDPEKGIQDMIRWLDFYLTFGLNALSSGFDAFYWRNLIS